MHLQLDEQAGQGVLGVGDDLDAGPAGVDVGLADLDVEDAVVGSGAQDHVHDLGQDERVDDVALDLHHLAGHGLSLLRADAGPGRPRVPAAEAAQVTSPPPWASP